MATIFPEFVNTEQLAELLAGGNDYIRTKDNVVKGLALKRTLNPDVPEVVVFGKGPRVVSRAELFLRSGVTVPAYMKRRVDSWQYLGQYRAIEIRTGPIGLKHFGRTRQPGTVAGALVLERVDAEIVEIRGGGFGDSKTRRAVEEAAVQFVLQHLKKAGFDVVDCQRENRGYDLLASKTSSRLYVEVKGTDASEPRFFLTRNEHCFATKQIDWRLFVVCSARTSPRLHQYSWKQAESQFRMEALAWECTSNDAS